MCVVGIICEYNPFHNGHKKHLNAIRATYGDDATIVAVMSGNFTERGEVAVSDKVSRARFAVENGVNLVLELPFPYSSSCAEVFATAGVSLLRSLGICNVLSFGSECGDISLLSSICEVLSSPQFEAYKQNCKREIQSSGYPAYIQKLYEESHGDASVLSSPNNVLALEYLRAAKLQNANFAFHTVKREDDYLATSPTTKTLASATAIRQLLKEKKDVSPFVPKNVADGLCQLQMDGELVTEETAFSRILLSHLVLQENEGHATAEKDFGLNERIFSAVKTVSSVSELVDAVSTKKYTKARVRRALLYHFFEVSHDALETAPAFTQVLAADEKGCALLKTIKRTCSVPIITKPSDTDGLSSIVKTQKALSDRADSVYQLLKDRIKPASSALTFKPYIKE